MSRPRNLIYGTAINDREGKITSLFNIWKAMWQRVNTHPAYKGYTIHKSWHSFSNFKMWADSQNYKPGLHLDKDLFGSASKEYSTAGTNCRQ